MKIEREAVISNAKPMYKEVQSTSKRNKMVTGAMEAGSKIPNASKKTKTFLNDGGRGVG